MPSPLILVVTRNVAITTPVMDYTITLAERMRCRLLVAYVDTMPHLRTGSSKYQAYLRALKNNAAEYGKRAAAGQVDFNYIRENGKIDKVIYRLCHIAKRIDFIVVDKGIQLDKDKTLAKIAVPMFSIRDGAPAAAPSGQPRPAGLFLSRVTA